MYKLVLKELGLEVRLVLMEVLDEVRELGDIQLARLNQDGGVREVGTERVTECRLLGGALG